MPKRHYHVNDPAFSEYVFHVMRLCPAEKKKDLNPLELEHFRSEKNIRKFADDESLDKRLLMLSRIGISYCLVVAPVDNNIDPILEGVTSQYRSKASRKDIVEAMAKNKLFVLSSRDTLVLSHMAAQNSHSQIYVLDYSYLTLYEKMGRMKATSSIMNEGMDGLDMLAKAVQISMRGEDFVQSMCGVSKYELQILLTMYPYRDRMMRYDRISELMGESYRSTGVAQSCGHLERLGLLIREPGYRMEGQPRVSTRSQVYMISDKGIDAVLKYLTYITRKALK